MVSPSVSVIRSHRSLASGAAVIFLALVSAAAFAHETDQYSVPVGRQMADLRMFFADDVATRISEAIDSLNDRIERTLKNGQPTKATEQYYSQEVVAQAVYNRFPSVVLHVEQLEARLHSPKMQAKYPGLVVAYRPTFWIYHHPLLLIDPTKLARLTRCSTVMVDGHYFGTDKFVHFIHMGHIYYDSYVSALKRGATEQEAINQAVGLATGANPFLSENTFLGMLSTGIRSNADLAANYMGLKFFRNLTEPMTLRGATRPPMLVRDGAYWRLDDQVRRNSDFFTWFVSDHWDEALVPNNYSPHIIGECVRQEVKARCPDVLEWYRNDKGMRRSRDDFFQTTSNLRTYYGEDYGFKGNIEDMVTIATVCFDATGKYSASATQTGDDTESSVVLAASRQPTKGAAAPADASDFHRAACEGNLADVQQLLARAADVNGADLDGETALHCAARWGNVEIAKCLLDKGANPNARERYGLAPLHLAAREYRPEMVKLLLERGATADPVDKFGCTPLHDAAARGYSAIASLLLKAGANVNAADGGGTTPLHRAARIGSGPTVSLLLQAGANRSVVNSIGRTPADEAGSRGYSPLVPMLTARQ